MAGTGETSETPLDRWSGPKGYVAITRHIGVDGEVITSVVRMFLTVDRATQWARETAKMVGDTEIETTLLRLKANHEITIGTLRAPDPENEEDEGEDQFALVPNIPIEGLVGGRRKRKTLRRRRVA